MSEEDQGSLVCVACGLTGCLWLEETTCQECGVKLVPWHTLNDTQQLDIYRPRTKRELDYVFLIEGLIMRLRMIEERPDSVDVSGTLESLRHPATLADESSGASCEYFAAIHAGEPYECALDVYVLKQIGPKT